MYSTRVHKYYNNRKRLQTRKEISDLGIWHASDRPFIYRNIHHLTSKLVDIWIVHMLRERELHACKYDFELCNFPVRFSRLLF